ncbi:MAG: glycine cleavage system aminomethyltransferase GcvT, partial [Pseudomonadota bacterium]
MAAEENVSDDGSGSSLRRTPLYEAHVAAGAKMVPFAGYEMPVQYPLGVLKEHLWTREKAGLFDVSHMGIAYLQAADGRHETAARALEALVPADILNLKPGQQRYTQLTDDNGGILDDLMVSRSADHAHDGWLFLVVNAACKEADYAHIAARLAPGVSLLPSEEFALIALQGPAAVDVLADHDPRVSQMSFMTAAVATIAGVTVHLTRSGYTGEDGFEIPVPVGAVADVWSALAADARVQPIGLGARDSLRLEAGL